MAKKKKQVVEIASPEERSEITLRGKKVVKNAKIDEIVHLRVKGKVTDVGRSQYDNDRLHQTIRIMTVKDDTLRK